MIYVQAGWFRVEQPVGPKHTNTSGDYSTGAAVVLHQMLPRGPTTSRHARTHTRTNPFRVEIIIIIFSPSLLLRHLTHTRMHTHTHKHTPMPPTLTRINTSQLTWTYPQHVWGPHNSAVFTGTAGPLRQAGCVSVHTPVPSTRRNDPHASPGGTQRDTPAWLTTWCEYHLAWPDWLQLAANRQCGGGQ